MDYWEPEREERRIKLQAVYGTEQQNTHTHTIAANKSSREKCGEQYGGKKNIYSEETVERMRPAICSDKRATCMTIVL
jgi:hypothetical protein